MLILIVDGEAEVRNSLEDTLKTHHEVVGCGSWEEGERELRAKSYDVVFVGNGGWVKKAHGVAPKAAVVLITSQSEVAREGLRHGAEDYVWRPIDFSEVSHKVSRIETVRRAVRGGGNVRELKVGTGTGTGTTGKTVSNSPGKTHGGGNVIPITSAQTSGGNGTAHVGGDVSGLIGARGLTDIVEELESKLVLEAMARTGNNQIKAAELLRITRGALQYKLKKYVKPQAA